MAPAIRFDALLGGRVWAPSGLVPRDVWMTGGRIHALPPAGTPPPAGATRHDVSGSVLLPGLCDAHCHLLWVALMAERPSLVGVRSRAEALARIDAWAREGDAPLLVEGWDESGWTDDPRPLTGEDLDDLGHRRPLVVRRRCTHVAAANAAALALFPEDPHVDRRRGRLTEEPAMNAGALLPDANGERERAVRRAVRIAHAEGVTHVHEFGKPGDFARWARVLATPGNALSVSYFARESEWRTLTEAPVSAPDALALAGVKFFADGSFGARTAALDEPYTDGGRGDLLLTAEALAESVRAVHAASLSVAVHAIGERAVSTVLDAFEAAGVRGDRVEHMERVRDEDVDRAVRLGVTASMQPNFTWAWGGAGGLYERALGEARARRTNRFGSFARGGLALLFGTDAMPFGVRAGLRGATRHPNEAERLSLDDALRRALPAGTSEGLVEGAVADVCVLDTGAWSDEALATAPLRETWVGGERVYEGSGSGRHVGS